MEAQENFSRNQVEPFSLYKVSNNYVLYWPLRLKKNRFIKLHFPVAERCVTSYYESSSVTTIQPLMTQPFDFRQRQSILPQWEELLLFNDNFETVFETDKNKNVVMFFEIIDFLPMSVANKNYNRYGQKGSFIY